MKEIGIYPDIHIIQGAPTDPIVEMVTPQGIKRVVMFSSNNYLGIANDPKIKSVLVEAAEKYGMGSGGSRLVSGNITLQLELESKIAEFKGYAAGITFATGYMANTGAIPALLNPPEVTTAMVIKRKLFFGQNPVVFSDALNHASIIDGCKLAKAERAVFAHKNLNDLERLLKKYARRKRKLIVTDGVFSMDGDIAPIPGIMGLAEKYGATVMIDDAHASGILGENGKGTSEYFKLKRHPEIMMGTFTKAFGAVGGFITATHDLVEYLRVTARTHIFSAPIPPLIVAGILEALEIIQKERRFEKLKENLAYLMPKLRAAGFNTLETETQIIPIFIGDEKRAIEVSRAMIEEDIFAPAIRWPAVSKGKSRLRLTIMSTHTKEHLDRLCQTLESVRKRLPF